MADFFPKDEEETEESQEPEKIKVGENEYSQEDLNSLVGLGSKLKEFEEKQGQEFDDVVKSWGQRGERIGEYKKEIEALKKASEPAPAEGAPQTEEQLAEQVRAEAKKYNLLTADDFDNLYQQRRSSERVLAKTRSVARRAEKEGKPKVAVEKLLEFMADPDNPKDPQKAYNVMFEPELDKYKEEQLMKVKKPGMITQETTSAGSKQPKKVIPTADNLEQMLKDHVRDGQ